MPPVDLKYQVLQGIFDLAGQGISTVLTMKPSFEEQKKEITEYYASLKDIARHDDNNQVKKIEQTMHVSEDMTGVPVKETKVSFRESRTTACVPCSKNHIAAIAGLLAEGKRFLGDGITTPAITERIDLATQELTAMERGDLHPDKIQKLPTDEREIAEWASNEIRKLRHIIDKISTRDEYMQAIHESSKLSQEMTKKYYTMLSDEKNINRLCKGSEGDEYKQCISTINKILANKRETPAIN